MAKSRLQIQRESDERRGVKVASFKFPLEFIAQLDDLAKQTQCSKSTLIMQAMEHYRHTLNLSEH